MSRLLCACVVVILSAVSSRGRSTPPAVAIALLRSDLPAHVTFIKNMSDYINPGQLSGDTVPTGLSIRVLRRAGFRGLFTQGLLRSHDDVPFGYPWAYLDFPDSRRAHIAFTDWVRGTVRPFNTPLGRSFVADECQAYQSVLSRHIVGLLCRVGPFVVFGHYTSRSAVERLMKPVIRRARVTRP